MNDVLAVACLETFGHGPWGGDRDARVQGPDLAADHRQNRRRIARDPNHQRQLTDGLQLLRIPENRRTVDHVSGRFLEALVVHVPHHADDLEPIRFAV